MRPNIAPVQIRFVPLYPVADLDMKRTLFLRCKRAISHDRSDCLWYLIPASYTRDKEVELVSVDISIAALENLFSNLVNLQVKIIVLSYSVGWCPGLDCKPDRGQGFFKHR